MIFDYKKVNKERTTLAEVRKFKDPGIHLEHPIRC
jgi:hypothetical protein